MNDLANNGRTFQEDSLTEPVELLVGLLTLLYPDPGPDILTLEDFKLRYRLTGKGALAIAAIEQTQRINRAIGNFNDIGLCEFHIGLINFYWNDYQGAAQQFREARQQWSFVDKTAALCLAHFAEGLALQHNFAYESALRHFGKAEHALPRINFEPSPSSRGQFQSRLSDALGLAQKSARDALWEPSTSLPEGGHTQNDDGEHGSDSVTAVESSQEIETAAEGEISPGANLGPLPPFSSTQQPLQLASPIPYHTITNDQFVWYRMQVQRREGQLFETQDQGWLLVNKQTNDHTPQKGDLIVIASDDEDASIVLVPQISADRVFPRICLVRTEAEGTFVFETGRGQLSTNLKQVPINPKEILGHVVGWWARLGENEILGLG